MLDLHCMLNPLRIQGLIHYVASLIFPLRYAGPEGQSNVHRPTSCLPSFPSECVISELTSRHLPFFGGVCNAGFGRCNKEASRGGLHQQGASDGIVESEIAINKIQRP